MYLVQVINECKTYNYPCAHRAEAEFLYKAMCIAVSGDIAVWQGDKRVAHTSTESDVMALLRSEV